MAEETTKPGSVTVAQAAANAVSPDPLTASLLAKHSAGERLSPKEYGKLGAFAKKAKAFFSGTPGPTPEQAQTLAWQKAGLAPVAPAQAEGDSLAKPPPDPGIVRRTTDAVLSRCEAIACRVVGKAAREAGASEQTLARFDSAARLKDADRKLMVEVSPEVAAALGFDPSNYPLAVFFGAAGLWVTDLWLVVQELKGIKEAKPKPLEESQSRAAASQKIDAVALPSTPLVAFPVPARPPGAPPLVTAEKKP